MVGNAYNEILEMIMRRLKLRLMTGDLDIYSDNLSFPYEETETSNDNTTPSQAGKPKTIPSFNEYDYHLEYNLNEELDKITSNDGKLEYTLVKDSFEDVTSVTVQSPNLQFKIALIYENYDIRANNPETSDKGKLTDVVLLDMNNKPFSLGLEVTPVRTTINEGESAQFQAVLKHADGSTEDVTTQATWKSSNSDYTVSNGLLTNCKAGTTIVTATLDFDSATGTLEVLSYKITVEPENTVLEIKNGIAQTVTFKAYKNSSNGTKSDVTNECTWSHGNNDWNFSNKVLTVNSAGKDSIVAQYGNKFGIGLVTATAISDSLRIDPIEITAQLGMDPKYTAIYTLNGVDKNVTSDAYWTIQDPMMMLEINKGQVSTIDSYRDNPIPITATYKGLTANAALEINEPQPPHLEIEPSEVTIAWGETFQFRAYRVLSDGSRYDQTEFCTWSIDKYRIGNYFDYEKGFVETETDVRQSGDANIHAYLNGPSDSADAILHVTGGPAPIPPTYELIIEPSSQLVKIGDTPQYRAYYKDNSGGSTDVTNSANWSIDRFSISHGLVTGINDDNNVVANITATYSGKTANATLGVPKPAQYVVTITPDPQTIGIGETATFKATATKDNVSIGDVTSYCTWSISKYSINKGVVTNVSTIGDATVTATYQGVSDTATLTVVSQSTRDFLEIVPNSLTMQTGDRYSFKSYYTNQNGVRELVTNASEWSSVSDKISVSTYLGTVDALSSGGAVLNASYNGKTATANISITTRQPTLRITQTLTSCNIGQNVQFRCYYTNSLGNESEVTNQASWKSTNGTIGSNGIFNATTTGIASITATYSGLNISGTVKVGMVSSTLNVNIKVMDNGTVDGDIINILVNGVKRHSSVTLTGAWKTYAVTLISGNNTITFEGVNAGTDWPITAYLEIYDNNNVKIGESDMTINTGYKSGTLYPPYPYKNYSIYVQV